MNLASRFLSVVFRMMLVYPQKKKKRSNDISYVWCCFQSKFAEKEPSLESVLQMLISYNHARSTNRRIKRTQKIYCKFVLQIILHDTKIAGKKVGRSTKI